MYRYDTHDQQLVNERVAQFRDQVRRRLAGEISENEFKPLRLQNGLYMQLHAYMLRVAIPYGLLSTVQLRKLAHIARRYDKGYGHWSTRQNIQYNWPKLEEVPDILDELASVEMHAIQTSGNCIRNTTADHLAGVARDELEDPRPYCEIIRQWSTFHPEFAFLPRKFKIAVTGSSSDRAAVRVHDIGLRIVDSPDGSGARGFEVLVGGGLGRTPRIARNIRAYLPKQHLLSYLEAILRVYNLYGRRDNKYKARIKILVDALGVDEFRRQVDEEWEQIRDSALTLTDAELARVSAYFAPPAYESLASSDAMVEGFMLGSDRAFGRWVRANTRWHKQPGYSVVMISCKARGQAPGDITAAQMDGVADIADAHGFGQVVVTHEQNLVLPDIKSAELHAVWRKLAALELAEPNVGRATDIIACPGLDYCNLANARSIPVAQEISESIDDYDYLHDLGELSLNISGCINACGHHHVGNIGILGIDKQGVEFYQLMLGGDAGERAAVGKIVGPAFKRDAITAAVRTVLDLYLEQRESEDERFVDYYRRVGVKPFKELLYAGS